MPYVEQQMAPAQAGAIAGRTLETVAMAVRAPLEYANFKRKSAKHSVCRNPCCLLLRFRPCLWATTCQMITLRIRAGTFVSTTHLH